MEPTTRYTAVCLQTNVNVVDERDQLGTAGLPQIERLDVAAAALAAVDAHGPALLGDERRQSPGIGFRAPGADRPGERPPAGAPAAHQ